MKNILWLNEVDYKDILLVGGKNASLGEMKKNLKQVKIPNGFCLTTKAYWFFLKKNNIDKELKTLIKKYDLKKVSELCEFGKKARALFTKANLPLELVQDIKKAYRKLGGETAVRSSAVCEDMPNASFAGQFETMLNVKGEKELLKAIKKCLASTFNDRVIAYREEKKISHLKFALSVGVLKMIRSDLACSGIMFTLDTETGFKNTVVINSIWGLGEMIVQGKITPDEFYVFKPTNAIIVKNLGRKTSKYVYNKKGGLKEVVEKKQLQFSLTDKEALILAKWGQIIEDHYSKRAGKWMPQDIEWAKDGKTKELFIVQSRPETIHSVKKEGVSHLEYNLETKKKPILKGIAIGEKVGQGKASVINNVSGMAKFKQGDVLVTKMTDPDWVPIMRMASAIITDEGGRTCHSAIVSRELGIPAVVGTQKGTKTLKSGQLITIDCTHSLEGRVYNGKVPYTVKRQNFSKFPKLKTKMTVNIGAPEIAFKTSFLPNHGVGLAREEFIIAEKIRVHPLALYHFDKLKDKKLKKEIQEITIEHKDKKQFFIKELAEGIGQIAAAFYPKSVIVRLSDFKSNEYANLVGGYLFENEEENPMIGFRGACRYLDKQYRPAFEMEIKAIKRAREIFGLKNINIMVPFCRTVEEGRKVIKLIEKNGLSKKDLKIYVMAEIPSNVTLADKFLDIFDGMSIGSNDLTQLALGLDRDNAKIAYIGNEKDETVKEMIEKIIKTCKKRKKYCGICGEAPSTYEEFVKFLIKNKIESMSLNPNNILKTWQKVAKLEKNV
ncbi:MAG: phosphoenolpyruvate synthase [Candidatus Pacebacteria bacterium]|nr:phosphoenolpyruvate synthase [Candidatus Paceibacterota bacterium]